ncbi:hypothetical protein CCHR01_03980 [Colletotrichum chrysophilum]|uniref:Uncharacterized protein n=1 Tax=Colletotrichum chrysophilum TaxID=1836956 RepID=A0AAD9EMZ8_9PEZI|nr:hypothetical protein CCHR01_03980 [Colletotrichum chrysophilum]
MVPFFYCEFLHHAITTQHLLISTTPPSQSPSCSSSRLPPSSPSWPPPSPPLSPSVPLARVPATSVFPETRPLPLATALSGSSLPTAEAAPTPVSSLMSAPLTASAKRTRLRNRSTERMKTRCCVDGSRSERCRCSLR